MTTSKAAIVVHGGAGSSDKYQDGCDHAAQVAAAILQGEGKALDAAIRAVAAMEDDGRFNAGCGSVFCLDGETVEMDAGVMDSNGLLGAVACLQRVKNPVLVAREVANTPHWLLAGEGAQRFARSAGFADYHSPSRKARDSYIELMKKLTIDADKDAYAPVLAHWNYAISPSEAIKRHGSGTVGAVVRGSRGDFAVATSTGGCTPALLGRVGDTPIIGCGFYAGALGAVAATGIGEYIARQMLARTVYGWIEQGMPLQAALNRGIALFQEGISVGLIAITEHETAASSSGEMATATRHAVID
ncbi:isoaspartyl peptidase/L-asparaginase [Noviherbaspirillum cavernae]|nr:isoaspartyl peptidase/L-asparaginase [Noviherbaspirillum cavernae]